MRILSAADIRAAEKAAVMAGTSYEQLMERAGRQSAALVDALAAKQGLERRVLLLCGAGNNAGDALVAARHLHTAGWACQVCLLLADATLATLAKRNLLRLPAAVAQAPPDAADFTAPVVVDGVFGIGFHGALPAPVRAAFARARAAALPVALDIPAAWPPTPARWRPAPSAPATPSPLARGSPGCWWRATAPIPAR